MARSYMQDITPPDENEEGETREEPRMAPERSIRNIEPSVARVRMTRQSPARPPIAARESVPQKPSKRWALWIVACLSLIVVLGAGALILFPSTTITVTPRTQTVPFDPATVFTAYPAEGASAGVITYSVVSQVFEDSATVPANGLEKVEEKATGVVTVFNTYSDKPVRLIKNTRFQANNGLIFRIPASVDVPGKKGNTPGSIEVTVFADQAGETYNLPPQDKFTLPGLKSTPDMFAGVYAQSKNAFSGGFSGERPAVAQATLDAARSEIRGRLTEKAQSFSSSAPEGSFAFPELVNISFETLSPTTEATGGVRIHERATVVMPIFSHTAFGASLAQAVTASAEGHAITVRFAPNVTASASSTLAQGEMGKNPLEFTLSGTGQLLWGIDKETLAQAIAGKEKQAFNAIVKEFPGVEEARARIIPLWQKSFPRDPAKIRIEIQEPPQPF